MRPLLPCAALAMLAACFAPSSSSSNGGPSGSNVQTPAALVPTSVAWNPSNADVGAVTAVAEDDSGVTVVGSKGVIVLRSGAIASSDASIVSWTAAAVVPSADGLSTWTIGIDGDGHVQRLVSGDAPSDVSKLYGLDADRVVSASGASVRAGFLLDDGFAITDGESIARYAAKASSITSSGTTIAIADGSAVRTFDGAKETDATLAGVSLVAMTTNGDLFAATPHALYRVTGTTASPIYDAGDRTIGNLVAAGANAWISIDQDLGVVRGGSLAVASGNLLPQHAQLAGTSSGDVWVLAAGTLARFAAGSADDDEERWIATIEPIYASICSHCHGPPGSGSASSGIDLSTYAAWAARRDAIFDRVVTQVGTSAAMPPASSAFSLDDTQRAAIAAWAKP